VSEDRHYELQTRISEALRDWQVAKDEGDVWRQHEAWIRYCSLVEQDMQEKAA
jgi:hypothetical protein